jgi:hypothetical protein
LPSKFRLGLVHSLKGLLPLLLVLEASTNHGLSYRQAVWSNINAIEC